MLIVPLLSVFMALSLSAIAQEPEPKKPPPKGAVQQKGPVKPGTKNFGPAGVARGVAAHRRIDPRQVDRRLWGQGRAYPYGCRFGRCGYWWWVDGYWYFYDQPFNGPPEVVSEFAYDEQGNLVPVVVETTPQILPPVVVPPRPPVVCVGPLCVRP
jgi:hypothetical protein